MRFMGVLCAVACLLPALVLGNVLDDVELNLSTEFRYRVADTDSGSDYTDQDWLTRLSGRVEPSTIDGLTLSMIVWYGADVDGTSADSPLSDTLDTYGGRDTLRVYSAKLGYEPTKNLAFTLGRQDVLSSETATIDGGALKLDSDCGHFAVELFGGRRVSFYSEPDDKTILGGTLELSPWRFTKLRIMDFYYLEHTFEAQLMQRFGDLVYARAGYRQFGDEPLEVNVRADVSPFEATLISLFYKRKLSDADDSYGYDYTAFEDEEADALEFGSFAPYSEYGVELYQRVGEILSLFGQARAHSLIDEDDEDEYNTDFLELAGGFTVRKLFIDELSLEVSAIRWVEDRSRDDIDEDNLWGGDGRLLYRRGSHKLALYYGLSRYDGDGKERTSRTLGAKGSVGLGEYATVDLGLERRTDDLYEEDGIDSISEYFCRLNLSY